MTTTPTTATALTTDVDTDPDEQPPPTEAATRGPVPVWQRGLLLAMLPELAIGLVMFSAFRQHLHSRAGEPTDRERGISVVEWILLIAIGAAMAATVGGIVYNKVKSKANDITTDTPAPGQ